MKKKTIPPQKIRLRFPPSPTGPLHIGNARTLLFNYLFAKKYGGEVVLRIEDTDTQRSELKWIQEIIEQLKWLGIEWNEGPDIGGKFGPYKQSQRLDIYKKYLEKLLEENTAYYCFCLPDELEAKRQDQMSRGLAPKYDGTCKNISKETIEKNIRENKKSVIRFKIHEKKLKFSDLIRGDVEFDTSLMGDIVIAKNLVEPLYNFAVVVDDFLMGISHVIRGEDHISNTPRQILLQEALGFDKLTYGHLPLLLNPDKSKMSKRAGDVAVSDYHANGYLPDALINFMALLGWNPGHPSTGSGQTEKEIFSLSELIKEFSIEKVQKAGAVFNVQKLDSINSFYIRQKSTSALAKLCLPYLPEYAKKLPKKTTENIIALHQPRMKKLSDITTMADYFFVEKLQYDKNLLIWKEMGDEEVRESLQRSEKVLSSAKKFDSKNLENALLEEAATFAKNYGGTKEKFDRGYLLWPLRVALSGKSASAGPFEIAEVLGKEKTLQRIQTAIEIIKIG